MRENLSLAYLTTCSRHKSRETIPLTRRYIINSVKTLLSVKVPGLQSVKCVKWEKTDRLLNASSSYHFSKLITFKMIAFQIGFTPEHASALKSKTSFTMRGQNLTGKSEVKIELFSSPYSRYSYSLLCLDFI
jgi:hypothetical protein